MAEHASSPYINHFIQPDTIIPNPSAPQSWNRYSYVQNNPIRYTDPTGHKPCLADEECKPLLDFTDYSPWEKQILKRLYSKGGKEGEHSVLYMLENNIHLKVGESFAYDMRGMRGDWQSVFEIGAWYEDNIIGSDWVVLNPNQGYVTGEAPDIAGLALLAHEGLHLEQGAALRNSVLGEWEAYRFGVNVKLNLGGVMNSQERAVMRQTTVEGYFSEVQKQYPGYMIKLLPMYPQDNFFLRAINSCVFGCP